jgi:hypothetical protein
VIHFLDETSCQELGDLLAYGPAPLIIQTAQALVHGLGTRPDAELVLDDFPRDARHVRGLPSEGIMISAQEVNERTFLFGQELGPNPHGLGRVTGIDLDRFGVLGRAKALDGVSSLRSGTPSTTISWSLLNSTELATAVASSKLPSAGIRLLEGATHHDDAVRSRHLQLEVGVVGDRHELGVPRMPEDGMVRSLKVYHLEDQGLSVEVAMVAKRDLQVYVPQGVRPHARDDTKE